MSVSLNARWIMSSLLASRVRFGQFLPDEGNLIVDGEGEVRAGHQRRRG